MYGKRFLGYVPEPQPVTADRIVATHYYPGWKRGGTDIHNGFSDLEHFPERCPVLGWYDESNPEVTDWEIKWAVEHGISCFIYCWYRYKENIGKPVTREALRLGHAIHEGLFRARYRNFIQFAIMFENQSQRWGNASDINDLLTHLLPWWVNEYFSKPNYLKINGKPILYVYQVNDFIRSFGGEAATAEAIARLDSEIQKYGFPGLHISACSNGRDETCMRTIKAHLPHDLSEIDRIRSCGFHSAFQYNWGFCRAEVSDEQYLAYKRNPEQRLVPSEAIVKNHTERIKERAEYAPDFFMFTASVGNNREPWRYRFNYETLTEDPGRSLNYQLNPQWYQAMLENIRDVTSKLPENAIGRKITILDAWNEWSEGHAIAPGCRYGFQYLQAVREVFTKRDNLPDYRTPQLLDFDRYDYEWFAKETGERK